MATEQDWKNIKNTHSTTYVWGEGYQVDSSQEFSNFTPKKIKLFEGDKTPDVVDVAFGWYHEAYIDKDGRLFVCDKAKVSSIRIEEMPDGVRNPMMQITSLPKRSKVKQVAFT